MCTALHALAYRMQSAELITACSRATTSGPEEEPPVEEVLGILRGWQALPKATLLKAFEAGNFAGEGQL